MATVHNSVETVNAAATAIVTAESRVQPSSSVQKRRWGSCWSVYWCFGSSSSYKHSKRIGNSFLLSEPPPPAPISETRPHNTSSSTIVLPFIAPPSSPASSFFQSEPPSATQSPAAAAVGLLSPKPIFTIGPYAHETQLVSPPVFSTFTTEPSTASFTPPPEPSVHTTTTTPSSPEVPFAQLLSSSLAARNRRNSGGFKYPLSQYEFQPYQYRSGSVSVSASGTSSPFPRPTVEPRAGDYYYFPPGYKWADSRVGSGSRVDSGTLTPSGDLFDDRVCEEEVATLANSDNNNRKHQGNNIDAVVDHRVSFELFGEHIPTCVVREASSSPLSVIGSCRVEEAIEEGKDEEEEEDLMMMKCAGSGREHFKGETLNAVHGMGLDGEGEEEEEEENHHKHRTISLGSSKDFNFNNAEGEVPEKPSVDCEWWTNEKMARKELGPRNSWSFFPMLQSGAS